MKDYKQFLKSYCSSRLKYFEMSFSTSIKGSDRLYTVVELSMQYCGEIF